MAYRVRQMMPAAPGMYLLDEDKRVATLVVMWVMADKVDDSDKVHSQHIVGLTHLDMSDDLGHTLIHILGDDEPEPVYTTQVPKDFKTFR